jgi:hypothetical protein
MVQSSVGHRLGRLVGLLAILASYPVLGAGAEVFSTPEQAVQTLVQTARTGEVDAILRVLGSDARSILVSGDTVGDTAALRRFVQGYDEAHSLLERGDGGLVLMLGRDNWPFPIPLVKGKAGWTYDTKAGKEEILVRRIGRDELDTIQVCANYVEAQHDYKERNPSGAAPPHYAARLISTPGKRDGLYWPPVAGEPESPFGPAVGKAHQQGYSPEKGGGSPYHGYYYRMLNAQGPHAEGGTLDYLVGGELVRGFALEAYPAAWGKTGVMTFVVNQDGVVFQKDLGPDTAPLAQKMKRFDPDDSWTRTAP